MGVKSKPSALNPDRRKHLVGIVAQNLAQGRPTYFAFEGACRHGLRVRFILEGWRWQAAEDCAADVVSDALRRIGAVRPTWYQGQPGYADEGLTVRDRCMRCHKPLTGPERQDNGLALRFCSNACRVFSRRYYERRTRDDYFEAQRAAGEIKRLERVTTCPQCHAEFIPKKPQWPPDPGKPRFCSNSCTMKWRQASKRRELMSSV